MSRRPLGGGMPILLEAGATGPLLTVFDTNDFAVPGTVAQPGSDGQVFAVTIYVWPLSGTGFVPDFGDLELFLVSSGNSVRLLDVPGPALATLFGLGVVLGESIKVADKLLVRGDQQITLQLDGGAPGDLGVYGYFETGDLPVPFATRPLEPDPLVVPFNAAPATITIPGGGVTALTPAHRLNEPGDYWDILTMFVSAGVDTAEGVDDTGHASVRMPNGLDFFIPSFPVDAAGGQAPIRLFDEIPLRAPAAGNNLIEIGATPGATGAGITTVVSTGSFTRIT